MARSIRPHDSGPAVLLMMALISLSVLTGCMAAGDVETPVSAASHDGGGGAALVASRDRLVFSAVSGSRSATQTVVVSNPGSVPALVSGVSLSGAGGAAFEVSDLDGPIDLSPGASTDVEVTFTPAGDQRGALEARVILTVIAAASPLNIELGGVAADGKEGELEPALASILDAFGLSTDVSGNQLALGTKPEPLGDELDLVGFRAGASGSIVVTPLARYSPDGRVGFGWYETTAQGVDHHELGALAAGNYQQVSPPLESGQASVDFAPTDSVIGLWMRPEHGERIYLDSLLNGDTAARYVRVWPVIDESGVVSGSYLVGFEEASNGDYQDMLLRLDGATPVLG